jgi:hypothetical protein
MMARFCAYVDKVFHFGSLLKTLHEPRRIPLIPIGSIFGSAFAMFATARSSLHSMEVTIHAFESGIGGLGGSELAFRHHGGTTDNDTMSHV